VLGSAGVLQVRAGVAAHRGIVRCVPGKYVRALFSYEAAADIELDLKEGDVIKVLKEDESGWWQGEVDGRVGWFPFNYIEVVD